jgi:hypothetical protein
MREKNHLAKVQSEENNCSRKRDREKRFGFSEEERNRVKKSNNVIGSSLIVPSAALLFHFSDGGQNFPSLFSDGFFGVCGKWENVIN